ncbi:MAG: acyl-CoA desaturase [Deltaproteobacteria bacterium]|nr:acyl-CoA desaturase [Deltaproteobacteria bacterium]
MFMGDATPEDKPALENVLKQFVFWAVHAATLLAFWTGVSPVAIAVCLFLYVIRMFAITGGYHRYFSHRTYKTSRPFQFCLAVLGASSAQKGPIWWASHHRHHHRHSDMPEDIHSPVISGIYYAHVGWVLSSQFIKPRLELVKDLLAFPELRLVDQYNLIPPILLGVGTYFLGAWLEVAYPGLHTNGMQMLVWGFFISTVLLYHGTFCINSFTHLIGKRRFKTTDTSRNNLILALITLGEGWHNNHHRYPGSEQQGMYWWEIDISHYILKALSAVGLVWDIRRYPERIYEEAKVAA